MMGTENSVIQPFYQLVNRDTCVLVDCRKRLPAIVYLGPPLKHFEAADLVLFDRHEAPASLPDEPAISLLPDITSGFLGHPGLVYAGGDTVGSYIRN